MQLTNNTILLTGGTSGIGFEFLRQFYQLDNTLITTSSSEANLSKLKNQFPKITTIGCDLGDIQSVKRLIDKCLTDHRNINVIINNAGIQYNYLWTEEKDGYRKISTEIQVNFAAPMYIIYGLLELLTEKREAALVNVSSGLALEPKSSAPVYCATKAAIHSATKALRYQLENSAVKVFEVIPPPVNTSMSKDYTKGKLSPELVVKEFIKCFHKDRQEINIGKIKFFRFIQRISPGLAAKMKKDD